MCVCVCVCVCAFTNTCMQYLPTHFPKCCSMVNLYPRGQVTWKLLWAVNVEITSDYKPKSRTSHKNKRDKSSCDKHQPVSQLFPVNP